jgi:hypothetical protein
MFQPRRPGRLVLSLAFALALGLAAAGVSSAHVIKASGPLRVEFGWGNEPPLSGAENFVEVGVSDASGSPVAVPAGALTVEVGYGTAATTLPLAPDELPGGLRAELTPTRPGTYSFRVAGTVEGHALDVEATCGEATFGCVEGASATEFPVQDPSIGELAQRLDRESGRAQEAANTADSARTLARAALAIAALALLVALAIAARARRRTARI